MRMTRFFLVIGVLTITTCAVAQTIQNIPYFSILSPVSIEAVYESAQDDFGLAFFGANVDGGPVVGQVVIPADSFYCQASVSDDFSGKIVLIKRGGGCPFAQKANAAYGRGAVGVLIWNTADTILNMGFGQFANPPIPVILVRSSLGSQIAAAINAGETVIGAFSAYLLEDLSMLEGRVRQDLDYDCEAEPFETGYNAGKVLVQGQSNVYFAQPNSSGLYRVFLRKDDGPFEVSFVTNPLWSTCGAPYTVDFSSGDTSLLDLPIQAVSDCPYLVTQIGTPFFRRCFDNFLYVSVCNEGTVPAQNAYVDVTLPSNFDPVSSASLPFTNTGNGVYRFELGNLAIGQCQDFIFTTLINCDSTVLGQTLCIQAQAYPDTNCAPLPLWNGANLTLTGACEGDSISFRIKNNGNGPMLIPQPFIVIEDDVMFQNGNIQLAPQQEEILKVPADGATWRLESVQVPNHPFPGNPSVTVEGCAENGNFTTGFFLQFPQYDPGNAFDEECQEVIGAYDPNDKQGFPKGVTDEHLILPNTDLEYLVRFQNTGTDTAFTVIIRDTLSSKLDLSSIRPLSSSHTYTMEFLPPRYLVFRFDNIRLVDSFTNEPASHGFIRFSVKQKPDLPWGEKILNSAAIYFDFNEPIITNQTEHTIGDVLHASFVSQPDDKATLLQISPNPAHGTQNLFINQALPEGTRWRLYDASGRPVAEGKMEQNRAPIGHLALTAGVYWLELIDTNKRAGIGKLIIR